ncbi:MAG: 50S ribosomal protein L32 [Verrucomicrobiota bacterium]|jgi:large subunit ribosomal protein L32|nr:50S ribosomal protein L32 [Verrucomicrobiota bacterium]
MAVPKGRSSKSRARKRRASNIKLQKPQLNNCPQCDHLGYQSHRACPECGYYNGRQVITVEAEA